DAVRAAVAGRSYEDVAGNGGVDQGRVHRFVVPVPDPAVVGDRDALGDGVVEGRHGAADGTMAGVVEEFQRGHLHEPVDARDADTVVAGGPDGAGDVRAVAVVVHRVVVVIDEVPADQVVHVAVAVVIDAVRPPGIGEEVAGVDVTGAVEVTGLAGVGGQVEV